MIERTFTTSRLQFQPPKPLETSQLKFTLQPTVPIPAGEYIRISVSFFSLHDSSQALFSFLK